MNCARLGTVKVLSSRLKKKTGIAKFSPPPRKSTRIELIILIYLQISACFRVGVS